MSKRVVMVSMTHWDREHARPFEQFRWHLVYNVMDAVLDLLASGGLPYFVLDGQVLALEDYLELRPERTGDAERLVREGKLPLGPFFVAPDELIPTGEGLVRNLLLGSRLAQRFGGVMRIGHNIDTFGRPAQMPQILRGFGIGRAVQGRGVGEEVPGFGALFTWRAPDGSQVLSLFHFVQTTQDLPESQEGIVATFRAAIRAADPFDLPVVLVGNGGDGAPPRPRLPEAVAVFNAAAGAAQPACDDVEMAIGTLDTYFEALAGLDAAQLPAEGGWPVIEGELHSGRHNVILAHVYSARCYLKRANYEAEADLFRYAEPLATAAWVLTGDAYPGVFLERALRAVLENHFHDTICGCSADPVYHDAMRRYAHAEQIAEVLMERATKRLGARAAAAPPAPGAVPVLAFNPHAWAMEEPVCARLYLSADEDGPMDFRVVDAQGAPVPCQVTRQRVTPTHQPYFWRARLPYDKPVRELEVCFAPRLGALADEVFFVAPGDTGRDSSVSATPEGLENALLRVDIAPDGTLSVTDKATGHTFAGLNRFEDEESLCGEYYHVTAPEPEVHIAPAPSRVEVTERGPLRATVALDFEWSLPACAAEDLSGRSQERVVCPLRAEVSLWAGVPRAEIRVVLDNRARDHRLRAVFPTGLRADTVAVETAFAVVQRPVDLPPGEGWADPPCPESGQQTFADVSDGALGLAVLNRGIPELGVARAGDDVELSLTLLRAVGWIARLHWAVQGYRIPTPEAQCLGPQAFEYALYPHRGDWLEGRAWEQAQRFAYPPRAFQLLTTPGVAPGGPQASPGGLLSVTPSELVLSAVKRAEDGDAVILRLWNVAPAEVAGRVQFGFPVREVWLANLAEEPLEALPVDRNGVDLAARAHGIVTIRVSPAGAPPA